MTTNARALQDKAGGEAEFAKLPTVKEAAQLLELAKQGGGQVQPNEEAKARADEERKILGKFKSHAELETAYQQLEARFGQQGQEVGQLRSLTDKLLELKTTESGGQGGRKAPAEVTSDELLRDPRAAIERVVQERTAPLEAEVNASRLAQLKQAFLAKHPTYESDMQNPEFQAFARATPYRASLVQAAIQNNVSAADELWTAWEEHLASKRTDKKPNGAGEVDRERKLREAAMVPGSGGSAGEGSSTSGMPIYSREALIKMRIRDPQGYYDPAFQEMITQAYREKRVR